MAALVECVPNFSEGRDTAVVGRIVEAMVAVQGVRLLDRSVDPGHNRAVVTILGSPNAVAESAFRGVAEAAKLIDMRSHRGEHPRMGAADVVPFVPMHGITMEECVELARRVGERIGRELSIPVFLYEEAATRPERRNLAEVRAPQFEKLPSLIGTVPSHDPDFGPKAMHPTAGAVAVGARPPLVAYNVYLNTDDVNIAKAIARAVRHQTGGLRYVKALGIGANEKGRVHVSMNLTNTAATPIHRVLEMIRSEAARYGVAVVESEVVGLLSADALLDAAEHYLQLNSFSRSQLLEYRLLEEQEESVSGFVDRVASSDAAPGGGSVAALIGALASALVVMVSRLTLGRKRFAQVEDQVKDLESRAETLRSRLQQLVEDDSAAYTAYMDAYRQAKGGGEEAKAALKDASLRITQIPLESARAAIEAMELALKAADVGNPAARTDALVAALAAHAATLGSVLNVRVNISSLQSEQNPGAYEAEASRLEQQAATLLAMLPRE
ncbi:MAG: glutamate formimidoyltransferase [Chloroflexota bacterium]|jgi:glutamate formiminotransferase/formiminotetrahydrofolate cyclodeaminase